MYDRIDLSEKLIHFVRALNRTDGDYIQSEMHSYEFGFGDMVEDDLISPFFILRHIIRKLQILSTWSFRNLNRTIYGDYPVVCFTDMPISAFVRSSIVRLSKKQKISNYALVFDKKQMFELGARPVIYGKTKNEELPATEKYRFVSFDLSRTPWPIDWTHEREWRWANFNYIPKSIPQIDYSDDDVSIDHETLELMRLRDEERVEFLGLNLDKVALSNIGIILKSKDQARQVLWDILWLIDTKRIDRKLFTYILYFDELEKNVGEAMEAENIETLIQNGRIEVDPYYRVNIRERTKLIDAMNKLDQEFIGTHDSSKYPGGITGISYPCFNDNFSKALRLLVGTPFIRITKWGRYTLDLKCLNQTQSLELNEKFVIEVMNPRLTKILGLPLTYYSVGSLRNDKIDTIDLNGVPFYTEPNDDEANYAHRQQDF